MADFIINDDGTIDIFDKKKKKESDKWDIRNATLAGQSKNNSWQQGVGEKEWYEQILQKPQSFEDGYQFGDVTKTVFGTAGDILSTGAKATWQNIYDIGMNVAGANYWALDKIGILPGAYDAFTDIERYNQDVAVVSDIDKGVNKLNEATRDNSVLGDFSKDVLQSAIQSAEMAGLSKFSKLPLWQANSLATGFRNEYVNALNNGATKEQATISGLTSGISEVLSEYLFSGFIKLPGTGSGIDTALGKATEKIGNQFLRTAAQYGINIGGEAFEEVLSGFGSALGQKLTYLKDTDFKDIYSLEDALENAGAGALSALFGSANPQTIQNIRDGRNLVTGLTSTQQKYIDEIAQQRMVEAEKRNAKLNLIQKGKINQRTMTDFEKGRLADTNKLQQVNLPGLSNKDMDLQQSAYKYGINPNSEFVVTTKTMLDNRGIKSRFDADAFKNINGNAYWTNNNGVREVVFNPNASEQAILEEIAIHELTHDLMSSKNSKGIIENQNIIDYVSTLDGYKESRAKLEKLYSTQTEGMSKKKANALINEEIVADTLGKNIGSQEYIRRLIDDEPSIAKNIYDWVVNKVANKNGVKNEKAYWNNVKNNFEKAYNMEYQGKGKDTRYSKIGPKGAEMASKADAKNKVMLDYLKEAKSKKRKNILLKIFNKGYSNEDIRKSTSWFQDDDGNWWLEISDANIKLRDNLKENHDYTLKEVIVDNEDIRNLFSAYPQLENQAVRTTTLDTIDNGKEINGQYNVDDDVIELNNKRLKNKSMRNTLLHEMQHIIQTIEGTDNGSSGDSMIEYMTSLGEIEAKDTADRADMTQKELYENAPLSSKKNPIFPILEMMNKYPNLPETKEYMKNKDIAKLYNEIYNNGKKGEYNRAKIYKNALKQVQKEAEKNGGGKMLPLADRRNNRKTGTRKEIEGLDNSSFSLKEKQLDIILKNNPVTDDYHTWIRSVDDIKTYEEALQEDLDGETQDLTPDFKKADLEKALETGKMTVYSSYPIEQGIFVTPSKKEAQSYAGSGKVYSKEINLDDVAWIDTLQGQYASVKTSDIRNSQQNDGWQSFLDNNFEAKGTKTRLGDIKLPSLTNTIQEEVRKQTSNALLPIANELKELNKNLTKVMNPAEIAQLTPQDASTTPNLPGINRNQVGDGRSSFFDNINNKVNMLNDEQKAAILSSNDVKYYDKVTNKDSLDKAYARLQENGQSESLRWFNKASENADATDVAEGWILLKHYADSGDTNGMVEVAKKLRDMGTKAGQTVQAFNILSRLTPEGMVKYAQSELLEAYDNMVKNKSAKWIEDNRSKFDLQPNEVQFIMDTMREVSTMEDGYDKKFKLAQIQKVLTDKLPPAKGAGMKAWMRISMLFNPKTQVRNVAGNALIAPINAFGDMFASGVDKLVSAKTGVRTAGNTNWKNYAQGMKTGLYQSYNDFKNGVNTRNIEGNRFEVSEGKSFNDNNVIGKALNKVDSLLSFMLDAGDRGFYEASFVNSINNQMVLNNTNEVTQDMIDIATQEALSRTWQDNNEYTKFVMNVRNGLNKLNIGGYGLGDVLIPFAKTPANLTKAIVEYSPVGLIGTINKGIKLNRSLTNGQYSAKTQHEFVQSLGKATAGTMLYILGIALANAGVTTGESDEDKDVSNFMKNTLGVNSYSIKIGDMSFTYDWAQPLAAPLAITANLVQKQKEEASLLENVVSTLDTAGNLLLEQSFMESISTVLNNNEGVATGMQEAILDLPARAIPTFLKQITDLTDGTQRQTFVKDKPIESMFNSIKAKIPGLSYTLDPSVDTMGREIKKYGGKNNLFNVFLNPANVSTENVSESAQEIYRLYKETGETNIMPRVAPYYVNKKGEKIILTTQQRTQYQKVSGDIIEANVANLLGSTAYQNMSDTKKAETINDIVNYSYNIAQMETLGTELSETYETAYEYAQIGDISDFYEFRNSIDDTDADTKRTSIVNYLYNSDLEDNQIANLYGNYYSSDKTLNAMLELRIPMREFIKFNSADIQGQYNSKTGQTISGSKKNATIEYVNTLNLSKAQRAILVKSVYSSHKSNDNDIIRYVNTLPGTANEKKVLLKSIGFDAYDDDVFNYINSQNISKEEKIKKLKELGFTVRDGRVYY